MAPRKAKTAKAGVAPPETVMGARAAPKGHACAFCGNIYLEPCTAEGPAKRCYSLYFSKNPKKGMADWTKHLAKLGGPA